MDEIAKLDPIAQIACVIGLFVVIGIAVYSFFRFIREM